MADEKNRRLPPQVAGSNSTADRRDLLAKENATMSWVEDLFDGPWDAEYADVLADTERTHKEAEFIVRELGLKESDRVLDIACGHGRHALDVAGHVAQVVGIDRTRRFIDHATKWAAERSITNVVFQVCDMRELAYDAEFGAAYNYFTSWGFYDRETDIKVLELILRTLKPGGRFLLEFIHRDNLMTRLHRKMWNTTADGTTVLFEHNFDFTTGHMHNPRTYIKDGKSRQIDIDLWIPSSDTLVHLLQSAGFSNVRLVQAVDGGDVTLDTRRIAVIGTRP